MSGTKIRVDIAKLPMRLHDIYLPHKEQTTNLNPKKKSEAMYWITGAIALSCLTYLNILNHFSVDDWRTIVTILSAIVIGIPNVGIKMVEFIGKIRDRRHKDRLNKMELKEKDNPPNDDD